MSDPDVLKALLWPVLTSTAISGATVWLLRKWISAHLEASIRNAYEVERIRFETNLKHAADINLERLRSDLSIEVARRSAELTRVHEKRMDILSRISGLLWALRKAVQAYTTPVEFVATPPKAERREEVAKVLQDLDEFFAPNRCFIPKATCQKIDAFREQLRDATLEFMDVVEAGRGEGGDPSQVFDTWNRIRGLIVDRTPSLMDSLNDDFQRILGILGEPQ